MNSILRTKYIRYVLIHILLFISSCIIGVFVGQVVGDIGKVPFLDKAFYEYFFHNLSTCIILIGVGIITYGYLTWIPLIYNGIVLGMAINFLSYHNTGWSILGYFSHAVFEIPALMLSIYLGKAFAVEVKSFITIVVTEKQIKTYHKVEIRNLIYLSLLMALFLLIASIIEAIPK